MTIRANEEILPLTPQVFYVLTALAGGHNLTGSYIARRVKELSGSIVDMGAGSIYKILPKLTAMGLVENPFPRIFRLTDHGAWWLTAEITRLEAAAKTAKEELAKFERFQAKKAPDTAVAELLARSF